MPSEQNRYTPEFKRKVAQKALDQSKKDLGGLSKEYDVPVSVILMWATELENKGAEAFETVVEENPGEIVEDSDIDLEVSDAEVAESVEHGVMFDKLNYKRLIFWSVFGIALVLIFIQALFEMYQYNSLLIQEEVSASSQYYDVSQLKEGARKQLDSYGVVNLEEGIYRIPIDSAISDIAAGEE